MSENVPTPATTSCPFCESAITETAKKCKHCGEWVARDCLECGTPLRNEWAARGRCVECEKKGQALTDTIPTALAAGKSRVVAAFFALLLGGLGAHKFYLGRPGLGVLYLLFCWTGIPTLIAIIEGIAYLVSDDEEFERNHG